MFFYRNLSNNYKGFVMVKVSVELVFPNNALYQDFLEGAQALGLSMEDYLLELVARNVPAVDVSAGVTGGDDAHG